MTEFFQLSDEVRNILRKFAHKCFAEGKSRKNGVMYTLLVSMYALRGDAKAEILDTLCEEIVDLRASLTHEEIATLQANCADLVRNALFMCDSSMNWRNGSLKMPKELVRLCHTLSNCSEDASVLLPFAGEASFAIGLPEGCDVKGFEISPRMLALARMNLLLSGITAELFLEDSCDSEDRFDYICGLIPFVNGREGRKIVDNVLNLARFNLAEGGEMCCILPESYCYGSEWFNLRKLSFDCKEYSIMVVSLPAGLLAPVTGLKLCLLKISRNKENKVTLVNVSDEAFLSRIERQRGGFFEPFGSALKVEAVLETIRTLDPKYVWTGNMQDVHEMSHDLDMTPSRFLPVTYDGQLAEGERLVRLDELIESASFDRMDDIPSKLPTIGMRELSSNYLNCDVPYSQIPLADRMTNRVITSDCLLMGFIGGKMKVARVNGVSSSRPVALKSEVVPFVVKNRDVITDDYLLRCLMDEFVAKQANAKAIGVSLTRLKVGDYKSLEIVVPDSLERQKHIYIDDTRKGLTDADRKLLEKHEEFRNDMHMKKHAMGQTIFNLNNWWKLLLKARENGNGIVADNDEVGKTHKFKVSEIYDNLQLAMSKLSMQLSKFDTGHGLGVKDIGLHDFVGNYISTHRHTEFEYVYDVSRDGESIDVVKFAPEALTTVLDNIISNACTHGFKGREDCLNEIRIDISTEGTDCVITVSNNGLPIANGVSVDDVFTYGRSSGNSNEHFGIGGYEVRKLMREFDGDVEMVSSPDSHYTVSYRLIFHNTNILMTL